MGVDGCPSVALNEPLAFFLPELCLRGGWQLLQKRGVDCIEVAIGALESLFGWTPRTFLPDHFSRERKSFPADLRHLILPALASVAVEGLQSLGQLELTGSRVEIAEPRANARLSQNRVLCRVADWRTQADEQPRVIRAPSRERDLAPHLRTAPRRFRDFGVIQRFVARKKLPREPVEAFLRSELEP